MENKLIDYFSRISLLSAAEVDALNASMLIKEYKKDDYLLKEGQYNTDSFFVLAGCVRQYKLIEGEEITTNFFTEEQWILSLTSFTEKTPSAEYLLCVEDCTIVVGNEAKAQDLFQQFPRFETISRAVMETVFAEQQKMMSYYWTDSPEQRYLRILNTRPDLLQRVAQYHLASYIGVKPESLSRIRKRLALQNKEIK